jgi:hypothetical protein
MDDPAAPAAREPLLGTSLIRRQIRLRLNLVDVYQMSGSATVNGYDDKGNDERYARMRSDGYP